MNQPSATVRLLACPRPFSIDRIDVQRPAGGTVAEHLSAIGLDPGRIFARVFIDDRLIPHAEWECARPAAGQYLTVRVVPTGGEGGGKDVLRTVAMIGVQLIALTALVVTGNPFIAFGISLAGTLAVSARIPPMPSRSPELVQTPAPIPAEEPR